MQYYCLCTNLFQAVPIIPTMFFIAKENLVSHVGFPWLVYSVCYGID